MADIVINCEHNTKKYGNLNNNIVIKLDNDPGYYISKNMIFYTNLDNIVTSLLIKHNVTYIYYGYINCNNYISLYNKLHLTLKEGDEIIYHKNKIISKTNKYIRPCILIPVFDKKLLSSLKMII